MGYSDVKGSTLHELKTAVVQEFIGIKVEIKEMTPGGFEPPTLWLLLRTACAILLKSQMLYQAKL